jgi:hypothetical protein
VTTPTKKYQNVWKDNQKSTQYQRTSNTTFDPFWADYIILVLAYPNLGWSNPNFLKQPPITSCSGCQGTHVGSLDPLVSHRSLLGKQTGFWWRLS